MKKEIKEFRKKINETLLELINTKGINTEEMFEETSEVACALLACNITFILATSKGKKAKEDANKYLEEINNIAKKRSVGLKSK